MLALDCVVGFEATNRRGEGDQTEGQLILPSESLQADAFQFLTMLRNDLEKVRLLAELVRKREKEKLRQTQLLNDVVDQFIFPYYGRLRLTLEKISA